MTPEEIIQKTAETLQDNCHAMANELITLKPDLDYQDATNVWLFRELAKLKYRLFEIEKGIEELKKLI